MPTCPKATTSAPENAEESGNLDCIDEDDNGSDYAGKVTVTVTGATCNKWSDADLGNWAYGSMGEYKKLPENFCRNPDNSKLPWCFVAGTKDSYYQGAEGRAFCDVPACPADLGPQVSLGASGPEAPKLVGQRCGWVGDGGMIGGGTGGEV